MRRSATLRRFFSSANHSGNAGGSCGKAPSRQLIERTRVDGAFEVDHLAHRSPVVDPAPALEFGLIGRVEMHAVLGSDQPQQKPALLLADAGRMAVAPDVLLGQPIAQPAARRCDQLDVLPFQADLLLELAIERFLGRFVSPHAALRKLPAAAARASAEEDLAVVANQHDSDIGAKAICVDEISHGRC